MGIKWGSDSHAVKGGVIASPNKAANDKVLKQTSHTSPGGKKGR